MTLEETLARLEEIVTRLDEERMELGDALALFEEGVMHLRAAAGVLTEADARVSGREREWIEAFAPDGGLQALEVSGNTELAEAVLTALRDEAPRRAVAAA